MKYFRGISSPCVINLNTPQQGSKKQVMSKKGKVICSLFMFSEKKVIKNFKKVHFYLSFFGKEKRAGTRLVGDTKTHNPTLIL